MREVRVEYSFLYFFNKKSKIEVPEKWEDLSSSQFSVCAKALTNNLTDEEFVSKFYGLSTRMVKRFSKFELFKLIECAEFVAEPTAKVNFFYLKCIPGTDLLSPENRLKNISFEHFILFDTFFFDYINTPTNRALKKFVAALYLQKGEDVTEIAFEDRINHVSNHVDISTLHAIFLNYSFIRKWLAGAFSSLFEYEERDSSAKLETKKRNKSVNKNSRPDWNGILDGLIGDDILHENDYRKIACLRAFKTINNRIKAYRKNGKFT